MPRLITMDLPGFNIIATESTDNTVCVTLSAQVNRRQCPSCGHKSSQVHSTYVRRVRDLPISGRPVLLQALVRRFRCKLQACTRKTFSEPLEGLAQAKAQRTQRVTSILESLILCTSSNIGARLASQLGIKTSPRTLLRVVNHGERSVTAPRILGIDDFALRRGRTYGTILCDLETGRPVDILLGRGAEPLTTWLREHPGVEVIARDRASAYADASGVGAPNAIQVADRFHLVRNVNDALREVVDRQTWILPEPTDSPVCTIVAAKGADRPETRADQARKAAAERLRLRYEEVRRRFTNGESQRAISEATGLD